MNLEAFPHLTLVEIKRGRAKLQGRGKQPVEVKDNKNARTQHAGMVRQKLGAVTVYWQRVQAERAEKDTTTVAMDFGRITVDEDLVLYLFGTPGQKRFDFMWEILSEGMLGFIVMVDSTRPETFREARSILETFRAYAPTPYVSVWHVGGRVPDVAGADA